MFNFHYLRLRNIISLICSILCLHVFTRGYYKLLLSGTLTLALYMCFAPYNIVLFAALSLVHSLLPLWSTYFLRNVSSHSLCLPFSSVTFKWSDWGHIYWQINRLLLPYRLPSGSVPHCISNQICHRQPPLAGAGKLCPLLVVPWLAD